MFTLNIVHRGGIPVTVSGENMNSTKEPVMEVTVTDGNKTSVFYQVIKILKLVRNCQCRRNSEP